jgi:hypothetical protein
MKNHPHPHCPHCRGPVVQWPDERSSAYLQRHYCSYQCERGARSERCSAANMARTAEPVLIANEDKGQRGLSGQCYTPYELHFRPRPGRVVQPATVVERGSALDGQ